MSGFSSEMDSVVEIIPDLEDLSVIPETPIEEESSENLIEEDQTIDLENSSRSGAEETGNGEDTTTIVNETVDNLHSEDLFKSIEPLKEGASTEEMREEITPESMDLIDDDKEQEDEVVDEEKIEDETEEPMEDDEGDEDDEEDEENSTTTELPIGKVRKIMKICLNTVEDEETPQEVPEARVHKKGKHKGKAKGVKIVSSSTAKMLIAKEAIFLTTVATELFIAAVTQQSSRITAATKKKTMNIDHLKRALSDSECFEFLQGCFQPSLIIGD